MELNDGSMSGLSAVDPDELLRDPCPVAEVTNQRALGTIVLNRSCRTKGVARAGTTSGQPIQPDLAS